MIYRGNHSVQPAGKNNLKTTLQFDCYLLIKLFRARRGFFLKLQHHQGWTKSWIWFFFPGCEQRVVVGKVMLCWG